MTEVKRREPPTRHALPVLCLATIVAALVLQLRGSAAFDPYFGPVAPVPGTSVLVLTLLGALTFLRSRDWFAIDRPSSGPARFRFPVLLGTVLSVPPVFVDLAGGFPPDLNVLPPDSLLFYPAIAVVAETVFHVVPLALLLLVLPPLLGSPDRRHLLLGCLLVAALPEPVFQVLAGFGDSPRWANLFVGVHLVVFSSVGLWLFDRHGFLSLLTLRLAYYVWWHLVWGVLRLSVVG